MRSLALVPCLLACGSSPPSPPPEPTARQPLPWPVPTGFRGETIPFPLDFAPGLPHKGVEELRFAPGFFDPAAPGYWSYAFAWRTDDPAELDAAALGGELTAYFRGLIGAVDEKHELTNLDSIVATARPDGKRFALSAHVIDAFK